MSELMKWGVNPAPLSARNRNAAPLTRPGSGVFITPLGEIYPIYSVDCCESPLLNMIVNLNNVSHVTVTGMRFELHFTTGGSHMQRFDSVADMLVEIGKWQEKTHALNPGTEAAAEETIKLRTR